MSNGFAWMVSYRHGKVLFGPVEIERRSPNRVILAARSELSDFRVQVSPEEVYKTREEAGESALELAWKEVERCKMLSLTAHDQYHKLAKEVKEQSND